MMKYLSDYPMGPVGDDVAPAASSTGSSGEYSRSRMLEFIVSAVSLGVALLVEWYRQPAAFF